MNLYVFEDVLEDYTSGMAMIAEHTLEDAQAVAFEKFGQNWCDNTLEEFLQNQSGFLVPTGVYSLADNVKSGVLHFVYGGGWDETAN